MSYQETYKDWLTWADEETKEELLRLTDGEILVDPATLVFPAVFLGQG